jgi:hypothetical protein
MGSPFRSALRIKITNLRNHSALAGLDRWQCSGRQRSMHSM